MVAGLVDGKHYTEYVESVKELKRQGQLDKAEVLLLRLIEAVEQEAKTRLRPITGGNSIWPYPIPFCHLSQSF